VRIRLALIFVLCSPAAAAPMSSCTRAFDKELELVLPAAVHARLAAMTGAHARRAAAFLAAHPDHSLAIGVDAALAESMPELPLMVPHALMQYMVGKGYMVEHSTLHEIPGGERGVARRPGDLKSYVDLMLPVWVHEISHGRVHERPIKWPVSATLEDELIASYTQALFTAEALAAEPGFGGLAAAYRAHGAKRAFSSTKVLIVRTLELGAASTEDFENMYRRAYSAKSALADPLTAGLRATRVRAELKSLVEDMKTLPPAQKGSADGLLTYGREDDVFWLDSAAPSAAKRDAELELKALRAELDAARPALRAWFAAAAGKPVDWSKVAPPRDVPVGVAPAEEGR